MTKAVFRFVFHKDHESSDDATIARRQIATPSTAIKTKCPQVQSRIFENANDSKCGCGLSAFVVSGIRLAVDRLFLYCGCLFLPCRSSRNVMSFWRCLCYFLVWFIWFVFVWLRFFCHHKGSGSHVHFCPRPCSSTYRWAKLSTHRHKGTTLNEVRALTLPSAVKPPCVCHRQETGQSSIGSHTQQDMVISSGATTSRHTPCIHLCLSLFRRTGGSKPSPSEKTQCHPSS